MPRVVFKLYGGAERILYWGDPVYHLNHQARNQGRGKRVILPKIFQKHMLVVRHNNKLQ